MPVAEPVALLILGLTVLILGSVTVAVMLEAAGRRDRLAERLAEHRRRRWTVPTGNHRHLRRDWAERPGGWM